MGSDLEGFSENFLSILVNERVTLTFINKIRTS